jgi:DNA-binding transcriptional ArsR family regulator
MSAAPARRHAHGRPLTDPMLARIAHRFAVLAEPARLALLNVLRGGERSVSELVEETSLAQANVSKHLRVLREHGFVARRRVGLFVRYSIADDDVFRLCDIMCGRRSRRTRRARVISLVGRGIAARRG